MNNSIMRHLVDGHWGNDECNQYVSWQLNLSIFHYIECYGKNEAIKFLENAIEKLKDVEKYNV